MELKKFTEQNEFKGQTNEHQSHFIAFIKLSLLMGANFV